MKRKLSVMFNFVSVLGLIFLITGPLVIFQDYIAYGSRWYKVLPATIIPALILFFISGFKEKRKVLYIVIIILHIILLWGYFSYHCFFSSGPFTDIRLYDHILKENNYPENLELFPDEIPEDVSEINMRYFRGMLQGKAFFVLKYKAPDEHIGEILKKYDFKNGVVPGRGANAALSYTGYAHIRNMDDESFLKNYGDKIYIYEKEYSNSYYTTGILILRDAAEVVYFLFSM